ncbi:MAG TPA: DedA family protein [Ktedonobacteraceae bacterium]|nr:DedA family protein [Ktedonobacteraceae bacterium]
MLWRLILHIKIITLLNIPFAALISLATLQNALNNFGYAAVAFFIMVESSGIPFPGETMLLLASFYAAISHQLHIPVVIACAAFGAIIGDNFGYLFGRTGGRVFVERYGKYVFIKPTHLALAEAYFAKHGNKTVFFGRFIALLRAWAAFLAGVNHMNWRTFLFYNATGGIVWATIYGTLGFIAGRFFHDNFAQVEKLATTLGWFGTALIVITILTILFVIRRRRHRLTQTLHQAIQNTTNENEKEEIRADF